MFMPKDVTLPDTLPEDLVLEIGTYLLAEKFGNYPNQINARITDSEHGYYIVCGLDDHDWAEYDGDNLDDDALKARCCEEDMVAIIEASDSPKFERRIQCGTDYLSFEVLYNVYEMLRPHLIIKDDEFYKRHYEASGS